VAVASGFSSSLSALPSFPLTDQTVHERRQCACAMFLVWSLNDEALEGNFQKLFLGLIDSRYQMSFIVFLYLMFI
jgi:hypothetical protein